MVDSQSDSLRQSPSPPTRRVRSFFWRAIRLRCPRCGEGRLFAGRFRMHPACPRCQLDLLPEPGYYLGSIYVNYGLTTLLVAVAFFTLYLGWGIAPDTLLWPLTAFCVLFPVWFFRYARSIWLAFDHYFDVRDPESTRRP